MKNIHKTLIKLKCLLVYRIFTKMMPYILNSSRDNHFFCYTVYNRQRDRQLKLQKMNMIILLLLSLISHNMDGTNNCFYNKVRNCFLDILYHTIMKIRTKNHCKKRREKRGGHSKDKRVIYIKVNKLLIIFLRQLHFCMVF